VRRDYETVGYAIAGRVEPTIEGQTVLLHANTSWVVLKAPSTVTASWRSSPPSRPPRRPPKSKGATSAA
jgi:hypothetical protein